MSSRFENLDPSEFAEYEDELGDDYCLDEIDADLSEIMKFNSSFLDEDISDDSDLNQNEYEDEEDEEDYESI